VLRLPLRERAQDLVAVEEPLEIRIDGQAVAVTMRTPGDDEELALGFCLTEGMRPTAARVPEDLAANTIEVDAEGFDPARRQRNFYTSSSCGVCGLGAVSSVGVHAPRVESPLGIAEHVVSELPVKLRGAQAVFDETGGLHAAGLFTADGELLCVREDVGRHNAVDKVIGWATRENRLPLSESILMVSGRGGFEIVQKALAAGVPVLASVSAPSSLAVKLARELGLTLIGFLRGQRFVVYAGESRCRPQG
jgi:FdhD protein